MIIKSNDAESQRERKRKNDENLVFINYTFYGLYIYFLYIQELAKGILVFSAHQFYSR